MSHHFDERAETVPAPSHGPMVRPRDPAPLGGRARSELVYPIFLILALGADIGAFFQVVSIVLGDDEWIVSLVVVGFAAVVVFLAHAAGMLFRAHATGGPPAYRLFAWLAVLVWIALGVLAFFVRWWNAAESGQMTTPKAGQEPQPIGPEIGDLIAALLFIALYVGAGLTAMIGAYLTHDLAYGRFRAAERSYVRAVRTLAARAERHAYSEAELRAWQSWSERMDLVAEQHRFDRSRFGDELKSLARQRIAESSKDPAVTDAVLRPGRELGTGPQQIDWK